MVLGVALLVLGGFFTAAMVAVLMGSSNDGFVIAGFTLSHQTGAAAAVAIAVVAMGLLFLGLRRLEVWQAKRAMSGRSDDRVPDIEELARLRLLQYRYEQLKREVEGLELRRAVALGELLAPAGTSGEAAVDELLLLPDAKGSTLSRRMRSEAG